MSAAGHQISEPHLVDFAEIWVIDPDLVCNSSVETERNDAVRIELDPANIGQSKLALYEHWHRRVSMVSDKHRAVCKLHDRTNFVESGRFDDPADAAQGGEVNVIVFLTEQGGKRPVAFAGPNRKWSGFASRSAGGQELLGGWSVLLQFDIRIGDVRLNYRDLAFLVRRAHPFNLHNGRRG